MQPMVILEMAFIYFAQKLLESSLANAKTAMALYTSLGTENGIIDCSQMMAQIYNKKRNMGSAFFYLGKAIATKDSLFNESNVAKLNYMSFEEKLSQNAFRQCTDIKFANRHSLVF